VSALIGALRVSLSAETANFEAGMKRAQRRYAATQTGVSQEILELGLKKLTVSIGNAEAGSQKAVKAFKAIGLSVDDLRGKNTGDTFLKVADAVSKYSDRASRAAIETALMSRNGLALDNALSGGSARLNALAEAANRLGIVLSTEQIQSAEETAHKLEAVKMVLEAQIAGTVAENAGAILSLSSALASLTGSIARFLGSNPQLALSIIGALLGGRVGGLPGMILGGAGGFALGGQVAQVAADSNPDLKFRMDQVRKAKAALATARATGGTVGAPAMSVNGMQTFGGGGISNDAAVRSAKKHLDEETSRLNQAVAQSAARRQPTPASPTLPQFLAPKGGGHEKKAPADRSDELLAQLEKEQIQAEQSILQAKLSLAGSNEERLQISVQLVAIEKAVQDKAVDEELAKAARDLADHKITKAAYEEAVVAGNKLKAAHATEAQLKLQAIVEEQLTRTEQANFEMSEQTLKWRSDALHLADEMATTAADHRRIQLQILDSEIAQRKLELEHEKDLAKRNGATTEEIKAIQDKIDHLPIERAQGATSINNNTMSPLEQWRHDVPRTAAEINQALQSIEVEGLDGLTDAITGIITGTEKMKDAFHQLAASILADLLKMTIKMMIFKALEAVMGWRRWRPEFLWRLLRNRLRRHHQRAWLRNGRLVQYPRAPGHRQERAVPERPSDRPCLSR
jgi:hypothetical protein